MYGIEKRWLPSRKRLSTTDPELANPHITVGRPRDEVRVLVPHTKIQLSEIAVF